MATILIIFIALSFCHFIVEGMILPVYKKEVQFEIIDLRNRLIDLSIDKKKLDKKAITNFANILAFTVNQFDNFNLIVYFLLNNKIKKEDNKELNKEVEYLQSIPEINSMLTEYNALIKKVFIINVGGWSIYMLPLFFLSALIKICKLPFRQFVLFRQGVKTAYMIGKDSDRANKVHNNELSHVHISSNGFLFDMSKKYSTL